MNEKDYLDDDFTPDEDTLGAFEPPEDVVYDNPLCDEPVLEGCEAPDPLAAAEYVPSEDLPDPAAEAFASPEELIGESVPPQLDAPSDDISIYEQAVEAECHSEFPEDPISLSDEEPAQEELPVPAGSPEPDGEITEDSGAAAPIPPEEEPRPAHRERSVRKGRPKRPKGVGLLGIPQFFAAIVWLLIILAIGVSLGRVVWVCAADVLAFGREDREVTVSITSEDTMETIAEKLHQAGLIRYPKLFLLYADLSDVEEEGKITTGTFTLNTIYDYHALVNMMSPRSGNRAVVENVLIPEGYNCRQIFQRLEEKGVCKAADLEEWAANGELGDYWFLENVERGSKYCLEGYLFPATYDFYENSTPKQVLVKLLDAFEANFTEELQSQLGTLNEHISQMMRNDGRSEDYIAANLLDLHDLITVASLIEKETADAAESAMVASVIYNRLYSWGSTPRFLNIDASVIYALDGKSDLTAEDMAVDSPYNTYTNTGLTPGPITNPGLASLKAALGPAESNYYYYVLNPETGAHEFSTTYEEHQKLVEQFKEMTIDE